jgi:hypothetical protein
MVGDGGFLFGAVWRSTKFVPLQEGSRSKGMQDAILPSSPE